MSWLLLLAVPVFTTDGSSVSEPHPYDAVWDDRVVGEGLASTSAEENLMEQKRTPSKKGVRWHVQSRKWRARVRVHGSQHHLGVFEKEADAIGAMEEAEEARARGEFEALLEGLANARPRAKRTSSKKGVSWNARKSKWEARIQIERNERQLGSFGLLLLLLLVLLALLLHLPPLQREQG